MVQRMDQVSPVGFEKLAGVVHRRSCPRTDRRYPYRGCGAETTAATPHREMAVVASSSAPRRTAINSCSDCSRLLHLQQISSEITRIGRNSWLAAYDDHERPRLARPETSYDNVSGKCKVIIAISATYLEAR